MDRAEELIEKMLALAANGSGATEAEAAAAMRKAADIARKNGIDLEQLLQEKKAIPREMECEVGVLCCARKKRTGEVEELLARAVAELLGCKLLAGTADKPVVFFVASGQRASLECGQPLYDFLCKSMSTAYRACVSSPVLVEAMRCGLSERKMRKQFCLGFAHRMLLRALELKSRTAAIVPLENALAEAEHEWRNNGRTAFNPGKRRAKAPEQDMAFIAGSSAGILSQMQPEVGGK